MIIDNINHHQNLFFELKKFDELPCSVFLKLEGMNFAGSIKLKPAIYIIDELEKQGKIIPGVHSIIESSSGNLAIALAMICHSKGYAFTAVIDPNTSNDVIKLLNVYKANIIIERERDINGGYLGTRIETIKRIISTHDNYYWINQYANNSNIMSHYQATAKEIHSIFNPEAERGLPTHIFVGSSTTGTLGGILMYFKEFSPDTKIIAVEPEGSITFSSHFKSRYIPGIGASRSPELSTQIDRTSLHDIVWVKERDTISCCNRLLNDYSLLLGGSTGSVISAIVAYRHQLSPGDIVIGISPDFGEKYIDTVYNPEWVADKMISNTRLELEEENTERPN